MVQNPPKGGLPTNGANVRFGLYCYSFDILSVLPDFDIGLVWLAYGLVGPGAYPQGIVLVLAEVEGANHCACRIVEHRYILSCPYDTCQVAKCGLFS